MTRKAPFNAEARSAEELLRHVVNEYHPDLYAACSFQKEASVIMDMLLRIEPEARFFTLDTDLLFPETYVTWRRLEEHYGVRVDVYQGPSLARQSELHGENLWDRDPDLCCRLRKVEPLGEALSNARAWITGLRRAQLPSRASTPKLHWDELHGIWKANPLAGWSDRDVWRYIADNQVPYNAIHDRGYSSIGCVHCTIPGSRLEGRWPGREKSDCGLHAEVRSPAGLGASRRSNPLR